jgi:hypothetical protein
MSLLLLLTIQAGDDHTLFYSSSLFGRHPRCMHAGTGPAGSKARGSRARQIIPEKQGLLATAYRLVT